MWHLSTIIIQVAVDELSDFCSPYVTFVTVHEQTRYKSEIAILDNAHLRVQTLCYFMLKSDWPNGDKSHLFEVMQVCFLHAVLLF